MSAPASLRHLVSLLTLTASGALVVFACGGGSSNNAPSDAGFDASADGGDGSANTDADLEEDDSGPLQFLTTSDILTGTSFSCRLTSSGNVHCWGSDVGGAIGDGIGVNRGDGPGEMGAALLPIPLGTGRTPVSIATFDSFSCAILDNASIKCWGEAVPGYGTTVDVGARPSVEMGDNLAAISLGTGHTAKSVAVGGGHACAILDDNSLKCWGQNASGQLGLGDTNPRGTAPNQMGDSLPAVSLGTDRSVKAIALGSAHTCVILDDSTVKCWGENTNGQLGLGDTTTRGEQASDTPDQLPVVDLGGHTAKAIAAGAAHTCVILDDNGVKCWGANASGQLGQGDANSRGGAANQMGTNLAEVALGGTHTARAISASGGANGGHTCAILDDSSLKCWGENDHGELGQGTTTAIGNAANQMGTSLTPISLGTGRTAKAVAAGFIDTCAALDDGTVKCWGASPDGELGQGDKTTRGSSANQMGDALLAINFGGATTATSVAVGASHACAYFPIGQLKCWGSGLNGRIAVSIARGDEPDEMTTTLAPVDFGGHQATQLCAGAAFSCAVLDDSNVKCWGQNAFGQLGLGDTNDRGDDQNEMGTNLPELNLGTGRTAKVVTCGANHACALLDDSSVKCWGKNASGQLGVGDTISRGTTAASMGDALGRVGLGGDGIVKSISGAGDTTCAVLDDESLKCWGENGLGQLGLGDTNDRGIKFVTAAGTPTMGNALLPVNVGSTGTARFLATGPSGTHRCAGLSDATLKCWGDNASAELGQGDLVPRGTTAASMGDALLAINLGTGVAPARLAMTDTTSCEYDSNGVVKCWGTDPVGLFGLGEINVVVGKNPQDMGGALVPVDFGPGIVPTGLAAGGDHACILFADETVKCWGGNASGELGLGDNASRGGLPNQMGSALPRVVLPAP